MISCDICKREKKHSGNWFVAYEQGTSLRVDGWSSRFRMRPETKHLCGQACLQKLMNQYLDRLVEDAGPAQMAAKPQMVAEAMPAQVETEPAAPIRLRAASDTSLTSRAAYIELESIRPNTSARKPELVPMPDRAADAEVAERTAALEDGPRYGSRHWRAKAWEREREREREEHELHHRLGKPDLVARHGL